MSKYFINVFLEVDSIEYNNDNKDIIKDLKKAKNLFDSEDDAHRMLHLFKYELGKYAKILHSLC